jgi:hypothetical protein
MAGFGDPAFYGDRWADVCDEHHGWLDPAAAVEFLAGLAGDSLPVVIGDMAEVPVSGPFRLVYLIFNTLFGLLTQARQAECFTNVARVLGPGGVFVIECFVPTWPGSTGASGSGRGR